SALFGRIRLFWRPRGGTAACCLCGWRAFCCNLRNRRNYKSAGRRDCEVYIFPKFFKLFSKLWLAVAGEEDERWTKNPNKISPRAPHGPPLNHHTKNNQHQTNKNQDPPQAPRTRRKPPGTEGEA